MRLYYRNNSVVIEVNSITDQDDAPVTDATVQAVVTRKDGVAVDEITNPIALTYAEGSYSAVLPPLDLPDATRLLIEVTADNGSAQGEWAQEFLIRNRPFPDQA